jgi:hypothetical protein
VKSRVDLPSGSSGELSPLLLARTDLAKAASADARVENMTVLPEGARTRTPGTRYIAAARDETRPARLIPFEAAIGDTYMLAINGGHLRVFKDQAQLTVDGLNIYQLPVPFADNQLDALYVCQSRDTLFIAGGGRPQVLKRITDINWTIEEYLPTEAPVRTQNTVKTNIIAATGVTGSITLSATFGAFQAGHVGSVWRIDEQDFSGVAAWKALETGVTIGTRRRNKGRIYEVVALNAATGDTGPNPPVHDDGDAFSSGSNVTWRFISLTGGYVRITSVISQFAATAQVITRLPDQVMIGSWRWFEAAWSDVRGWPTGVSIVDQSLVWTRENEYWISTTSDIYSFDLLNEEESAVTATINAPDGKLVDIQWILPFGVLILGTRAGEWIVRAQNVYEKLTATNQRAIPAGTRGSAAHQPVMIDGGAVYIGRSRKRLHFAKFDGVTEQVTFQDFTTFARHMLRGQAMQLAWTQDPLPILWVRMKDGTLNAITLMPEQDVTGWHRRPFINGSVLQIAAVQSADETRTELWLYVERVINGQARRYYEVMQPYFEATDPENPDASGAWFLDCALSSGATPQSVFTTLQHLEGQMVGIFANGQSFPRQVVTGGTIRLSRAMPNVLIGIPLEWKIKGLPLNTSTPKGITKGVNKSANRVTVHVHESAGGFISAGGEASGIFFTGGAPPAQPLALNTGEFNVSVDPVTENMLQIEMTGTDAMPFTLLGYTPDLDVKDS